MNQIRFIFNRMLKFIPKRVTFPKLQSNHGNILILGGFTSLSTFLWYDNKFYGKYLLEKIDKFLGLKSQKTQQNFISNVTTQCSPSIVTIDVKKLDKINAETGQPISLLTGTGFVIRSDGWILTNIHNVTTKSKSAINIITHDKHVYEAKIIDLDKTLDLALLKIDCEDMTPITLGNSSELSPGEWIISFGTPFSPQSIITAGVISSVKRNAKELGIKNTPVKYIQTDASTAFSHSGGPLVNLSGEVIGINNLGVTAGISFAIPIDDVKEFLLKNITIPCSNNEDQSSDRIFKQSEPLLYFSNYGIVTLPACSETLANMLKDRDIQMPSDKTGVLVWSVEKFSHADRAGLMTGDVILKINDRTVINIKDLYVKLLLEQNDSVTMLVKRNGIEETMIFKLKE